jgi:iron-sulfur cluster repair protein YtfE (RIC family)
MPLTHDHHHALAQARRLRVAAGGGAHELLQQSKEFLDFFYEETIHHFREEEEVVFPLAIQAERAVPLLTRVVLEHLRIHALVLRLSTEADSGVVRAASALELSSALDVHIRFEEGEVFPLLEEIVSEELLSTISLRPRERGAAPDPSAVAGVASS